jgi:Clathrin adaptor complex small chain
MSSNTKVLVVLALLFLNPRDFNDRASWSLRRELSLPCIDSKVVYRRYASLFFVTGISANDNELVTLEIIHRYVEVLDRYFGNVSFPPCLLACSPLSSYLISLGDCGLGVRTGPVRPF